MVNVTFLQHFMIFKTNKKEARTLNVQLLFLLSKTYSRQLIVQIEEPVAKLLTYGSETQR